MVKLSLCMIVKNEEGCLGRCLFSVKGLVDEIIIIDTGSTDGTKEIARAFGANVFDFEWCDDFSAARNESIKHATGDWILILDADETVASKDHARIRLLVAQRDAPDGFTVVTRTYQTDNAIFGLVQPQDDRYKEGLGYAGWLEHAIVRLFKNKGFTFRGRIHELIEYSIEERGGMIAQSGIPIHHFGEEKDEKRKQSKQEMYHHLQEKKLNDSPNDPKALFELGMQCLQGKKPQEARHWLEKSLSIKQSRKAAIVLLHVYAMQRLDEQALDLYRAYFEDRQDARIEFIISKMLYKRREYGKAQDHLLPLVKAGHDGAHELLAKTYLAKGRPDAARPLLERIADARPQARYNLALIELQNGRRQQAIEHLRTLLALQPNHQKARAALEHIQQSL